MAHVATITGWTWDYIEAELDIPRLKALTGYWADHPPVHVLVAAYLGFKPKEERPAGNSINSLDQLAAMAGQALK